MKTKLTKQDLIQCAALVDLNLLGLPEKSKQYKDLLKLLNKLNKSINRFNTLLNGK